MKRLFLLLALIVPASVVCFAKEKPAGGHTGTEQSSRLYTSGTGSGGITLKQPALKPVEISCFVEEVRTNGTEASLRNQLRNSPTIFTKGERRAGEIEAELKAVPPASFLPPAAPFDEVYDPLRPATRPRPRPEGRAQASPRSRRAAASSPTPTIARL